MIICYKLPPPTSLQKIQDRQHLMNIQMYFHKFWNMSSHLVAEEEKEWQPKHLAIKF